MVMKIFKKIVIGSLLAFCFVFTACTDESELVVPDLETTSTTSAEGTEGEEIDRERD